MIGTLKRALLYDVRMRGKSLGLFLLFSLATIFLTLSIFRLNAVQESALTLRETIGASFRLQGNPLEYLADDEGYSIRRACVGAEDIDRVLLDSELTAFNARQGGSAKGENFLCPSGRHESTIWADTQSAWDPNFADGILRLEEGHHITKADEHVALISRQLAQENALQVDDALIFDGSESVIRIAGIYGSDADLEFDADTVFVDHNTYWELTGAEAGTYCGAVDFYVADPAQLDAAMARAKEALPLDWEDYTLQKEEDEYETIAEPLERIGELLQFLIVCIGTVSCVVLSLVLTLRIRERTREAGILLGAGIRKSCILIQFLIEALLVLCASLMLCWPVSHAAVRCLEGLGQGDAGAFEVRADPGRLWLQYTAELLIVSLTVMVTALSVMHKRPRDLLMQAD